MQTCVIAFLIRYEGIVNVSIFFCVLQEATHSQPKQLEQIPELRGCGSFLVSIK